MLTARLKLAIKAAYQLANDHHHEYITLNHLLLGLVLHTRSHDLLEDCGIGVEVYYKKLLAYTKFVTPQLPQSLNDDLAKPTVGFKRIWNGSHFEARKNNRTIVRGIDVLAAMFSEVDCYGINLLLESGLDRAKLEELLKADAYAYTEQAA